MMFLSPLTLFPEASTCPAPPPLPHKHTLSGQMSILVRMLTWGSSILTMADSACMHPEMNLEASGMGEVKEAGGGRGVREGTGWSKGRQGGDGRVATVGRGERETEVWGGRVWQLIVQVRVQTRLA